MHRHHPVRYALQQFQRIFTGKNKGKQLLKIAEAE